MESTGLKDHILTCAHELGFDLAGVAPAGPIPTGGHYREWLAAGHAGEMGYMARNAENRADPSLVFPDVKSILVVGMNYFTLPGVDASTEPIPPRHMPQTTGRKTRFPAVPDAARHSASAHRGNISRYAWGHDYHDLMSQRLTELMKFIRQNGPPGTDGRWYVDTGPILERDIASRSGIGWVGKHTNLINRDIGTWFFLGEILLNIELPPDTPASAHCGKCTRCIDICPTKAILEPYVLDARRCISYLTIELKGPIPREFRPLIGNRIYGCDDCVDVCPWNRFAQASKEAAFQPRMAERAPLLRDLILMNDRQFRTMFRGSPIQRIKRHGFLRNVAVALGNSGDRIAIPALVEALKDPHPLVRGHVAWALGRLGGTASKEALVSALAVEAEAWIREELEAAIQALHQPAHPSP